MSNAGNMRMLGALLVLAGFFEAGLPALHAQPRPSPSPAEIAPRPLFPDAEPVCSCESLTQVSLPNTRIESAAIDPVDGSCRVVATITHPPAGDRVKVFIGLPVKGWNGRFRGIGGGGFKGQSLSQPLGGPVALGYATGATDTGHEGASGSFALDAHGRLNWQAIRNNAYLGIHEMTVLGKALTRAFYGRDPGYSYFIAGSSGGRQALVEAQRYPGDYDGIVAACPAIYWARLIPAQLWPQVVMLAAGNFMPKSKFDAVTAAAVAACDGNDGVLDGVIDDPSICAWDPENLVGTMVDGIPFTRVDAAVVRNIWEGPRTAAGKILWHGLARGADLSNLARTAGSPLTGRPSRVALDWFRFFLRQDPDWDWTTLTLDGFEHLWMQSVEQYETVFGPNDADLRAFRDRGGKLIIYHGLADQGIPPGGTIQFFERLQRHAGGPAKAAEFARLFLVPGVDHGFRGAAPSPVGVNKAILRWVEKGEAPDRILAELRDETGKLIRSRPIFPYPRVARYKGAGSTDDAANFVGVLPLQAFQPPHP